MRLQGWNVTSLPKRVKQSSMVEVKHPAPLEQVSKSKRIPLSHPFTANTLDYLPDIISYTNLYQQLWMMMVSKGLLEQDM